MMNDKRNNERDWRLQAYLDGELTGEQRRELERDLRRDPDLQRRQHQYEMLQHHLHGRRADTVHSDPPGACESDWQIQAYLDDALSPEQRERFERDLQRDAELQRRLRQYRSLVGLLPRQKFQLDERQYDLQRRGILRRLHERTQPRRKAMPRLVYWPTLAGLAAAAILVVFFGVYMLSLQPSPPEPSAEASLVLPAAYGIDGEAEVSLHGPAESAMIVAVSAGVRRSAEPAPADMRSRWQPERGAVVVTSGSAERQRQEQRRAMAWRTIGPMGAWIGG